VDHVIAAEVNPGTAGARRPPLNLLVGRGGGSRGLDYSSYSASGQPVAGINNPWNAYSDFMNLGGTGGTGSGEAEMRILQRRQSVLDLVRTDFDDLARGPLSSDDRQKLDAHFTAIRTLEMTMGTSGLACLDTAVRDRASMYEGASRTAIEAESAYPIIADLQVDIMAIALACDATRVATLQFDRGSGGPTFRWDGMDHE
jgi:hypothetical protein